jgi:hypothetical protein
VPASISGTSYNFIGVTVRHNESSAWEFPVKNSGDIPVRVQGPVAANDAVGLSPLGGSDFATNGAYLVKGATPSVGMVLQAITDNSIKTILVRLGAGGGGGAGKDHFKGEFDPGAIYELDDEVVISTGSTRGNWVYISTIPSTGAGGTNPTQLPYVGGGQWMEKSSSSSEWMMMV